MAEILVCQVLFSGLGGQGSVAFSFLEASEDDTRFSNCFLFFGREDLLDEYEGRCAENNVDYDYVQKASKWDLRSYWRFFRSLKQMSPDVVLLHSANLIIPVFLYALLFRKRFILVEHLSNQAKGQKEWLWSIVGLVAADHVVYLTKFYREEIQGKFPILFSNTRTSVVPNGVFTSHFLPGSSRKSIEKYPFQIGMIGRLTPIKDFESLILATKGLSEKGYSIELHIAGDGETRSRLDELVKTLDLKSIVRFHGLLSEKEIITFLQSIDFYVHSSFGETMPMAVVQAMSCGLPVVATDVPGLNNLVVDSYTGILVPPKDPKKITEAISFLIENPPIYQQMMKACRGYAEREFSCATMFSKYKAIITNVLSSG